MPVTDTDISLFSAIGGALIFLFIYSINRLNEMDSDRQHERDVAEDIANGLPPREKKPRDDPWRPFY